MTKDKDEKALIRARMAKTGESYSTAKAQLGRAPQSTAGHPVEQQAPGDGMSLTIAAGQALSFASRVGASPWLVVRAMRATRGIGSTALEQLGVPKLSYEEIMGRAPQGRSLLDSAAPLPTQAETERARTRLQALCSLAEQYARAEGREGIDSGTLLRAVVHGLRDQDVPEQDREHGARLRAADLAELCAEVERAQGPELGPKPADRPGPGLFDRFTDRSRVATVAAQEEARALGHSWIGTEHLLLGLLREGGGLAATVLAPTVSLEQLQVAVKEVIGERGDEPQGHIPFTPRSKSVFDLALQLSLDWGDEHIGTEHLLLALVEESDGIAAQLLAQHGLTAERVRDELAALRRQLAAD